MNNKGINLIALIIMIVIIIILAAIAMNNSTDSYDNALVAKAKEERSQITQAVNSRFGDYQINSLLNPLVGEVIPEEHLKQPSEEEIIESCYSYLVNLFVSENRLKTDDELENQTIEKQIRKFLRDNIHEMQYTRILRHSDTVELGLESISMDSVFLVNYYSIDVVGPIQ